ncbi:peptidoglycan-binding protein [Peterkaempfera sp. SMS 1(5)a]|uniref:peptidoglycan-binding domain-containing protein n=1 Tax=Peterkaempfera podocarpi TaxID=3232308 RepID=UPI00366B0268
MVKKLAAVAATTLLVCAAAAVTATDASAMTSPVDCGVYSTSEPQLAYGSSGAPVKALQCELNSSMANTALVVDGVFGQSTYNAVIKFQGSTCAGTGADGIVGAKTWAALDRWSVYGGYVC